MSTTQELGTFSVDPKECIALTFAEVEYSWKTVLEPRISRAVEQTGGELTAEDVFEALKTNCMHAWVIYQGPKVDAVLVLEVVQARRFRICRIVVISGEGYEEWKQFEAFIEHWARCMNCQYIDGFGRPGWLKKGLEMGYKHQYTVLRKKITTGVH